jgi:hypothetical protein
MELLIDSASEMEGEEKEIMIELLANHMKKSYLVWNKDAVGDDKIFLDLIELSRGKLKPEKEIKLSEIKQLIGSPKGKNKKSNKGKSNKRH